MSHDQPLALRGVFPAVTTQFHADGSLDPGATRAVATRLVEDGVAGLVGCGSVGENTVLTPGEKRDVLGAICAGADGRVPVVAGLAEATTEAATVFVRDAQAIGAAAAMVMPPMVYVPKPMEIVAYFREVARASALPVMIYNNPPAYRTDVTPEMLLALADEPTILAVKESSGDTRRFVDIVNLLGDRLQLLCGLDDVILETVTLGATGWISGISNVFPRECNRLFELALAGRGAEALPLYRWLMPLLHLDARGDLVQCIKLAEALLGRGSETVRAPRLVLEGIERAAVEDIVEQALRTRPQLEPGSIAA